MRTLFLIVLASGATSKAEVSPVQKVVELLMGLKGKVEADLAADEKLMNDYSKYCDEESNNKEDAITSNKRTVGDLNAAISEASASVGTLTTEIEELAAKIATADSDLKSATEIREKEHADFAAAEAELVDTIDTLSRATIVLKRGQTSFLQKGSKDLSMLSTALSKVIEASWVDSHQRQQVQALLQSQDTDEDLSLAPQATTSAFESQGGGILDTLKDMQEKAEASLSDARKDEMSASHAFEMLKQSLDTELKTMNARKSDATSEKSANEEAKAAAEENLAATQKTLDSDTKFLAELTESCKAKANEWAARQKSAQGELGAIAKAKEILEQGVKVLLQVQTKTTSTDEQDRRAKVADLVRGLATKDHSFALSQLAAAAASDPFGKVRGLIESMIDRLEKEAAEEADAKSFCDAETSKSKASQKELTARSDKYAARIEKGEAAKAELAAQIKALEKSVAEMDAGQAEATALRKDENAEYQKASKDYRDSAEAVANAVQVLQDYYSTASFVQVSQSQAPEFGSAKSDVASTIISMLEVAESDFTELLSEAEAEESAAQAAYDKLTQENKVAKAAALADAKGKKGETKSLEAALLNYKEDHASTNKELDAVLAYLDKLKPQCETKVMTYAERKAKREAEIEGLKQALEILAA